MNRPLHNGPCDVHATHGPIGAPSCFSRRGGGFGGAELGRAMSDAAPVLGLCVCYIRISVPFQCVEWGGG